MQKETLQKGNELQKIINQTDQALDCFEWQPRDHNNDPIGEPISRCPQLLIEFDGDDRETMKLPIELSKNLITYLKEEIIKVREKAISEFNNL